MAKNNIKRSAPFQIQGISDAQKRKFNTYAASRGLSRRALLEQYIDSLPRLAEE